MPPRMSRRTLLRSGALVTSMGLTGCTEVFSRPSPEERLRAHEDALRRFADVSTAIEEGYRTTGKYVRTREGVLGEQFVNLRRDSLEPENPQSVLYGLKADGTYEALGVKWYVPAEDRETPPTLFGKEFVGPLEGDSKLIPTHYALHAWLFRENPDGLFATYNSAIDPPKLVDEIAPVRERLLELSVGETAIDQGYENTEECVDSEEGGYGVPFVKTGAEGGTDPMDPPVLVYRLTQNWSYRLMGAEWYAPSKTADETPKMFGRPFHGPAEGHGDAMNQPNHYGLHAWFFHANPRGMFAPYNPSVSC